MCYMIERKYFSCSLYLLDETCFVNDRQFIFTIEIYFLLILLPLISVTSSYLGCCWFSRSVVCAACVEAGLVSGGAGEGEAVPPLRLLTVNHGTRLEMARH